MSLSSLEKFNILPENLKQAVSSDEKMAVLSDLENKYGAELALFVIRIMVKEINISDMAEILAKEHGMTEIKAKELEQELRNKIFDKVIDYLELEAGGTIRRTRMPKNLAVVDIDWPGISEELFVKLKIKYPEERMNERLKSIIITRIRDIRDTVQTREMLMKRFNEGGLGMDENKSDEIIILLNQSIEKLGQMAEKGINKIGRKEFQEFDIKKSQEINKKSDNEFLKKFATQAPYHPVRDATPSQTAQAAASSLPIGPEKLKPEEELMPPVPAVAKPAPNPIKAPARPAPTPIKKLTTAVPAAMPVKQEATNDQVSYVRRPQVMSTKPVIQDVKAPSQAVVGDVQEFRMLDLKDFRLMGINASETILKLKEKMNNLANENYAKKIEAVKAYYKSPLYTQYLEIAKQVVAKSLPAKEVIKQMQAGKETMTAEEFNQLSEFNEAIRY